MYKLSSFFFLFHFRPIHNMNCCYRNQWFEINGKLIVDMWSRLVFVCLCLHLWFSFSDRTHRIFIWIGNCIKSAHNQCVMKRKWQFYCCFMEVFQQLCNYFGHLMLEIEKKKKANSEDVHHSVTSPMAALR